MKSLLATILDYQRKYFDGRLYSSIWILLVGLLLLNYSIDLEDSYIDQISNPVLRWAGMLAFHGVPFLIVCGLLSIFGKKMELTKGFWLRFFIGFSVLALDRSWGVWELTALFFSGADLAFLFEIFADIKDVLVYVIPFSIAYYWIETKEVSRLYGLNFQRFDVTPYLIILAIAGSFIFIGGFFSDIQSYYPIYMDSGGSRFAKVHELPNWVTIVLFELSYGLSFISVELFFRGFLIIALYRYLGPYVVLPMVVAYCILHFGKPLTESISSVFGGYVLGIISLKTRNIWGGVMVHVGVAWLMEIVGALHRIIP